MITILTWVSILAGGILILLFLLSLIGGFDLDTDIGSTEVDTDGGGLGLIKGMLTFVSVGSWVMKILLGSQQNPAIAACIGVISGLVAFAILSKLFQLLLRNEENVNWSMDDALFARGNVYLKIPAEGTGIVNVEVNGVNRELKAKSSDHVELKTDTAITVVSVEGEFAHVRKESNINQL